MLHIQKMLKVIEVLKVLEIFKLFEVLKALKLVESLVNVRNWQMLIELFGLNVLGNQVITYGNHALLNIDVQNNITIIPSCIKV